MKIHLTRFLCLFSGLGLTLFAAPPAPIRVICVGDSITAGSGTTNPERDAYPAQLQRMLGEAYLVKNYGVSGATLLNSGDKPYQKTEYFQRALASQPDIVVIQLGTNDAKPQNWKKHAGFAADYQDLVRQFQALPTKPRIFLNLPPYVPGPGRAGITESTVLEQIPIIRNVAKDTKASLIDVHGVLLKRDKLFPDNLHPNTEGATVLAKTVYAAIVGHDFSDQVP